MTAETREAIDRLRKLGRLLVSNGGSFMTTAAGSFGGNDFLRISDTAEAHLDEPARLASAHETGVREGIEKAAQWHGEKYRHHWAGEDGNLAAFHLSAFLSIRALSPAPAEAPTTTAVETTVCLDCGGTGNDESGGDCECCCGTGRWPTEASAPVAPDWPTRCAALEADGIAARRRVAALEAENKALREVLFGVVEDADTLEQCDMDEGFVGIGLDKVDRARALLQGQGGADASGGDDGRRALEEADHG